MMSTRTPFVPNGSRPASRVAYAKDDSTSATGGAKDAHANMSTLVLPSNKNPASSETDSSPKNMPKHLNINGLFKKPPAAAGSVTQTPLGRKSSANRLDKVPSGNETMALPALTKSHSIRRDQAGTPSVLAPKPLNAVSASELLSSSSFKSPSLQPASSGTALHVASETHTSITDEESSHPTRQYKFGSAPPQRVLLNDESSRLIPPSVAGFMPKNAPRDRGRSSKKRGRTDLEPEDDMRDPDMIYAGSAKRYRGNSPMQMSIESEYVENDGDRLSRPAYSPQPISSPIERPESRQLRHAPHGDFLQHASPSVYHVSPAQNVRQHQHPHSLQNRDAGMGMGMGLPNPSNNLNSADGSKFGASDALDKLLGCEADAYIEDHMERYDQLAAKWKDCSMDEWVKGADEIMAKYMKIMDFVKDHMSTKLKLFASFDEQVEARNSVLSERDKVLDGVKAKLVAQSGSILG